MRYIARSDGRIRFRSSLLGGLLAAFAAWMPLTAAAEPPASAHLCSMSKHTPHVEISDEPISSQQGALRLELFDTIDILPIPAASIELRKMEDADSEPMRGETDADGQLSIAELAPGEYALTITARFMTGLTIERIAIAPGQRSVLRVMNTLAESELVGVIVRRRGLRLPRLRVNSRPSGDAQVHIAADPARWQRVAVRCQGATRPHRATLEDGEIWIGGLPEGKTCRVRLVGQARGLVIEFVAGDANTEIDDSERATRPHTRR